MTSYLQKINYSSVNEDSSSEIKALKLTSEDSVLCITGSGARVLDLLIEKPKKLLAVDINPFQNYLLELKMSTIKNLTYEEFVAFIGLKPSKNRIEVLRQLSDSLTTPARIYWDNNHDLITPGVLFQGGWEKYFGNLSRVVNLNRPKLLRKLFDCKSIEEQNQFWKEKWDDSFWKLFIKIISNRIIWKYIFRDPGFYKYVGKKFSIYNYIQQKFNLASSNFLFTSSPFMYLLFNGSLTLHSPLPCHLQKENFNTLKENINKVQIVTSSLSDYLNKADKIKFSAFSLSDFSSYVNLEHYRKIWEFIINRASTGARFCERQFLVKRKIPEFLSKSIKLDHVLENELEKSDNSIFYSFVVGSIGLNNPV